MTENDKFLTEQIITYIGNKRKLLNQIAMEVNKAMDSLGKDKGAICDLFSGSGIVARKLKQYSTILHTNDLELYSEIINQCYLTNKGDFDMATYDACRKLLDALEPVEGIITENYAPRDDENIKEGERVFYTHENAMKIDTWRIGIDALPEEYRKFFLAPLLYEASVHVNTSGVFKGFYKSKTENIGKFGGDGENALDRIKGRIDPQCPVFSNFDCESVVHRKDANILARELRDLDIVYLDPPYNQHPYGSNYFMLNTIVENRLGEDISKVAGIPKDWNKSAYNKKNEAMKAMEDLVSVLDAKYLIISYNNEGFISLEEMTEMLRKYGDLDYRGIDYVAFRGSRNLKDRDIHTTEYLFTLKKS